MKNSTSRTVQRLAALLFLFPLGLGETASAQSVYIGIPPPDLWGIEQGSWRLSFLEISGLIAYTTPGKSIDIKWRYRDPATDNVSLTADQHIALSFWPTEVLRLNQNQFLVAGKRGRGATVIQKFTITSPDLAVTFPLGSLTPEVDLVVPTVTSIDEVFSEKLVGLDMVSSMFRMQGSSGSILVQFFDSKDVYKLVLHTGDVALVASPNASGTGIVTTSKLTADFSRTFARDHSQLGYLYGFHAPESSGTGYLFLVDDDRDDDLDSALVLLDSDWHTMGLSDTASYNP